MTRMIEARQPTQAATSRERRALQAEVRATEAVARRSAVATSRLGERIGCGREEVAERIGLSRRTLFDWDHVRKKCRAPRPRGRPCARIPRSAWQDVRAFLSLAGPRVSLDALRASFPEIAPAALEDLRERFRFMRRRRDHWLIRALDWQEPGWVWAVDFAEPPHPMEGEFPYILLVRDLGSGMQLAALPCRDATAETVQALLEALFATHGVPLVIKWDNAREFREMVLLALLRSLGILCLYSPPALPQYNGACEAGVGSIKTRAHHEAARHGRPYHWTCDDVEAARRQANEVARPWGWRGPPRCEVFASRRAVPAAVRRAFHNTYAAFELAEREARDLSEAAELDWFEQTSIDRVAIARALSKHNILEYRRKRITLPFNSHSRARIS